MTLICGFAFILRGIISIMFGSNMIHDNNTYRPGDHIVDELVAFFKEYLYESF